MDDELTIGQLSERSGVPHSALRYYEDLGLLSSERTLGGQRRYHRDALRRVSFVKVAQQVGLSLDEIGEALASLPSARTPTVKDWERLSASWRPRLDAQIETLTLLRDRLDRCIGCGCLSLGVCRLANPGDVAGGQGPGAQYLQPGSVPRAPEGA